MSVDRKKFFLRAALTALCVLLCGWIFSNSATPAAGSDAQSGRVLQMLQSILDQWNIPLTLTVRFVRKTAHFVEYAALGGLLFCCVSSYTPHRRFAKTAAVSAAVAVCDELIQLVTPGRSCQISDMLLDVCGAVCGGAAVLLLFWVYSRRKNRAFS
ncbi:MAG: VanZ family protein [Clostridia bacterium]|nr:VanZ family protein [Clostridia bacterium]